MPRKTIYIREEDAAVFDEAMRQLGGEEGMGRVIVKALQEQLRDRKAEEDECFRLKMLELCGLPPLLASLVQRRLQDFSLIPLVQAATRAGLALTKEPEHFTLEKAIKALLGDETWFEKGRELAAEAHKEWVENVTTVLQDVQAQMAREGKSLETDAVLFGELILKEMEKRAPQYARLMRNWPGLESLLSSTGFRGSSAGVAGTAD